MYLNLHIYIYIWTDSECIKAAKEFRGFHRYICVYCTGYSNQTKTNTL